MPSRPRVLIEDWLPMAELGIESRREGAPIPGQFPKLKTLHVWWARRPLAASAGAVLGSLMPAWSPELAGEFPDAAELASELNTSTGSCAFAACSAIQWPRRPLSGGTRNSV